ncbi:MAG: ABC transporter permease [Anaerolineales bacterium]
MGRITSLAQRVMLQLLADKRTLALMLVVPVVLLVVASLLIRLEPSSITVAVVNQDEGYTVGAREVNLGERYVVLLSENDAIDVQTPDAQAAQARLADGELDALITLPPDFSEGVATTQTLTLPVQYEGSNPSIAANLSRMFERSALQATQSLVVLDTAGVPELNITLAETYENGGADFDTLDYMAPALIGMFVFMFVFLLTSVSFLRERMAGTLERLQATPIHSLEIITGYMLGFLLFGLVQSIVILLFTVFVMDVHYTGNLLNVFVVEALLVIVAVNLGIFLSTFARNEFQVLQFMPLVVVSQFFLGGVVWAVEDMPGWLQPIAELMPLTHATDALRGVMIEGASLGNVWASLLALVGLGLVVLLLSAQSASRARI